eukprot:4278683-Alexandrium_andersonii.AAC.1
MPDPHASRHSWSRARSHSARSMPAWSLRCAVRGAHGRPPRPRHPMPPSATPRWPWPSVE